MADQLGKSTCTVSKWCQNTTQPDLLTLEQIAQLLEVDIRDLLVGTKLTTTSKYWYVMANTFIITCYGKTNTYPENLQKNDQRVQNGYVLLWW